MRQRSSVLLTLVLVAGLTACASSDATPASAPEPPDASAAPITQEPEAASEEVIPEAILAGEMPPADEAGQQRADAWLAAVQMPAGAVASSTPPTGSSSLAMSQSGWWCQPMGLATGYWSIPDAGVIETANWLMEHPAADLIVPVDMPYPEDTDVDSATIGNVPSLDSLEGIALTIAKADDGVVVRAEVGAFGDTTVCPTPPPGSAFGGPGQG